MNTPKKEGSKIVRLSSENTTSEDREGFDTVSQKKSIIRGVSHYIEKWRHYLELLYENI